jgi:hypothetical protein
LQCTCLLVDLTGCLTRWTRSGGPNSRSDCKFSVRISTTEVESSSKILFVIVSLLIEAGRRWMRTPGQLSVSLSLVGVC